MSVAARSNSGALGNSESQRYIDLANQFSPHNYHPLPVVVTSGQGAWVFDADGKRYLDMLSAYSAVSFGHSNPRLVAAAKRQMDKITLTSRAFYNDQFAEFCRDLAQLCGMDLVLPMNSGAEAVETAIKSARLWGYEVKAVAPDQAEIICFTDNFHGRTTTIVGFSTSEVSKRGFGPFTPGFKIVEYGNLAALEAAITGNTVALLIEPIQGEAGIIIPPQGYLTALRQICDKRKILLLADEIQTGLCRTGKLFACEHESVTPDLYILGKALGGAILPLSAVAGPKSILGLFAPGSHGSTFGGNPLACAVGREVIALIKEERPQDAADQLGSFFMKKLESIKAPAVKEVRGRGLLIGVDIYPRFGTARDVCEKLLHEGMLCKDTREQTIRFAPPLIVSKSDLEWALEKVEKVFKSL